MKLTNWNKLGFIAALAVPVAGYAQISPAPSLPPPVAPVAVAVATPDATTLAVTGLPAQAGEVVKLSRANIGESVVLTYINNAQSMYNLTSDNILQLKELGVSSAVISAMLTRDQTLRMQNQNTAATAAATMAPPNPPPSSAMAYPPVPPPDNSAQEQALAQDQAQTPVPAYAYAAPDYADYGYGGYYGGYYWAPGYWGGGIWFPGAWYPRYGWGGGWGYHGGWNGGGGWHGGGGGWHGGGGGSWHGGGGGGSHGGGGGGGRR